MYSTAVKERRKLCRDTVKLNCADAGMSDGMIRGAPARPIQAFHVLSRPNSSPRLGPSTCHVGPTCKFRDAPSPLTSRRHLGSLSTSFARSSGQKPSKATKREGSEREREREGEAPTPCSCSIPHPPPSPTGCFSRGTRSLWRSVFSLL